MPERPVQTRAAQARRRHEPDLGLSEGILDHLLLDQDESGTRRALCGDIGVTLPGASHRADQRRVPPCLAESFSMHREDQRRAAEVGRPKRRERGRHGAVDDVEQIAGQRRVGVEAEEHVARHHGVPRDPHLAVTEARDRRDAAIDRTPLLAADRYLDLDAALLADIDLLHRQRISLKQPTDHLGCRHGLRLGAPVGHGLLGQRLDPRLDPGELGCLFQGVAGPLSRANVCWSLVRRAQRSRFWGGASGVANIAQTAATEALAGLVERVTFHNPENGFCVLRVKARGQRDLITVVGHAAMISAGEFVQMSGAWVNDRTHGQQFRASFLKASPPTTLEGIERYLASGMIRGIGPVYAKRLVRGFGEAVFDLIEQQPERLREVTGIGAKRAARIIAGWAEQKVIREIMLFLHANGVGTSRAVRIYKTYGNDAVRVISENPYRLARDIRGIGFRTADQIAAKVGIEKTALVRIRAGISYALAEAMNEGHCGLPVEELTALTARLLEVSDDLIATALALELEAGDVVADLLEGRRCVFLTGLYRAEQTIAERLRVLLSAGPSWPPIDAAKAIPWVERRTGLQLAASQREAVRIALSSKVLVITGGPGVGKTTLVNSILKVLIAKQVRVALCAPTGRAAKRLSDSTGLEAKTIHRLLETDPRTGEFRRTEEHPLDCDLLVVDEASMVDVLLMRSLLRAVPDEAALLIVGDVDQLPSVGPGQVLADIIASDLIPVVRLTEVFRQAAGSRVITNAHRINSGQNARAVGRPGVVRLLLHRRGGARGRCRQDHRRRTGPHSEGLRAGRDPRCSGAVPDEPRRPRRALAEHRAAEGAQSTGRGARRALRLDLLPGRQGHAGRERLRPRGLQW